MCPYLRIYSTALTKRQTHQKSAFAVLAFILQHRPLSMCPTFLDYFRVALSVTVNSVICAIFFRFTGTFQTAQWQDIAAMVVLFTACRSVVTSHLMPDHISDNALRRYGHNTDQETEHRSACTTHTSTAAASMNEAESLTESGPAMNSVEHAHVTDVLYMCDDASLQTERCEMVEETDSIACATASALWSLSTENDPSKIVGVGDDFQHLLDSSTIASLGLLDRYAMTASSVTSLSLVRRYRPKLLNVKTRMGLQQLHWLQRPALHPHPRYCSCGPRMVQTLRSTMLSRALPNTSRASCLVSYRHSRHN
jgi:hypothetical protein